MSNRVALDVYGILEQNGLHLICYCYAYRKDRAYLIPMTALPAPIAGQFTEEALAKRPRRLFDEPITLFCDMHTEQPLTDQLSVSNFSGEIMDK